MIDCSTFQLVETHGYPCENLDTQLCESCSPYLPESHYIPDAFLNGEDIRPGHQHACVHALEKSLEREDEALANHNKLAIMDYGNGEDKSTKLRVFPVALECPFYEDPIDSTHCSHRKCWILLDMTPEQIIQHQALRDHSKQADYEAGYGGTPKRTEWHDPKSRQQMDATHYHKETHYKNGQLQTGNALQ